MVTNPDIKLEINNLYMKLFQFESANEVPRLLMNDTKSLS